MLAALNNAPFMTNPVLGNGPFAKWKTPFHWDKKSDTVVVTWSDYRGDARF